MIMGVDPGTLLSQVRHIDHVPVHAGVLDHVLKVIRVKAGAACPHHHAVDRHILDDPVHDIAYA
jgi:hypothetical protein